MADEKIHTHGCLRKLFLGKQPEAQKKMNDVGNEIKCGGISPSLADNKSGGVS